MEKLITSFVGLDVHKDSIAIGVAPAGREAPHFVGTVAPQWSALHECATTLRPIDSGRRQHSTIFIIIEPTTHGSRDARAPMMGILEPAMWTSA
jgi:hypothetical protein